MSSTVISLLGRNLFRRAILHSGSALASWSVTSDPMRYTIELADRVNCSEAWTAAESAGLLQCLKQLPFQDLVQIDIRRPKYLSAFGPTIDKRSVLPSDVRSMMSKLSDSVFASTTFLVALTRREGL